MRFITTKLATDWKASEGVPGWVSGFVQWLGLDANPDYRFDLVSEWLLELDEQGMPHREIGLDDRGQPVLAGPDERNYGFWLDTNMRVDDFDGEEIASERFEAAWRMWNEA